MASKTTLNARNLEALGAQRLAELLIEISAGDAAAKRKLRLSLAGTEGPKEVAREITKRLTSIARARTFVDWQNRKPLVEDLETQRRAIIEQVAPHDPAEALALLWRFIALARPVFERCDDSSGTVIGIFHEACADLVPAAEVLSEHHPLAATLALRAMINFTLSKARSKRYRYAAEHLVSCADLARRIGDFAPVEPHDAYVARLKQDHGRKSAFWSEVRG